MLSSKLFGHFSLKLSWSTDIRALSTAWNRKEALERSIILYRLHANGNADYISLKLRHFINRIRFDERLKCKKSQLLNQKSYLIKLSSKTWGATLILLRTGSLEHFCFKNIAIRLFWVFMI